MFTGGMIKRRNVSRPLWLAFRATAMSVTAIVVAVVVDSTALPKLQTESKGLKNPPPAIARWVAPFVGRLPYVPVPALVLGVMAIALPRPRPLLAILAMALAALSLFIIVGALLSALATMYQPPSDLSV